MELEINMLTEITQSTKRSIKFSLILYSSGGRGKVHATIRMWKRESRRQKEGNRE
jgi:hypothetical protein